MTLATVASYDPTPEAGSLAVIADPNRLDAFKAWSQMISGSGILPDALKGKPADILVTVLTGLDFGFRPMQAFQWVYVVKGKPSLSAEAMRALLQRDGHEFDVAKLDKTGCTVRGRRKGTEEWREASFTEDDRKAASLAGDNWTKYREDMLFARATTRLCKRYFSDVIGGLPSVEELQDQIVVDRPSLAQVAAERDKPAVEAATGDAHETREAVRDLEAEFSNGPVDEVTVDAEVVVEDPPEIGWPDVKQPGSGALS